MRGLRPRRRVWAAPSEVEPGTGVATQLELMRKLVDGEVSGPDFSYAWLDARRKTLNKGERVREKFERILDDVFYLLDEYVEDPALREPGDITDEQLTEGVRDALERLSALERN